MNDASPTLGVIFDLDGTLVDSGLDFDLMRAELELPAGQPILEAIDAMSPADAERCHAVLDRHEREGVRRSSIMPSADAFLEQLRSRDILCGIATRNSRRMALASVVQHGLEVQTIVARDDAQPKPHAAGLLSICCDWQLEPAQVVMIGDFRFDLEAARAAGMRSVLYTAGRTIDAEWAQLADFRLESFEESDALLAWLGL
jgi:HAD superfamily hydrolase (TIGR01509 family)